MVGARPRRRAAGSAHRRSSRSTAIPAWTSPALVGRTPRSTSRTTPSSTWNAAAKSSAEILAMIGRNLTDDRVFGVHGPLRDRRVLPTATTLGALAARSRARAGRPIDPGRLGRLTGPGRRTSLRARRSGAVGDPAAAARGAPNWHAENGDEEASASTSAASSSSGGPPTATSAPSSTRIDYVLDTNTGVARRRADHRRSVPRRPWNARSRPVPRRAVLRPRRVGRPVDEERLDLDRPSDELRLVLRLRAGRELACSSRPAGGVVEIPAMDLVLSRPRELLGEKTFRALRGRVPHPLRLPRHDGRRQPVPAGPPAHRLHPEQFGMHYTQDESYYLLDADDGCGRVPRASKTRHRPRRDARRTCRRRRIGQHPFEAEKYREPVPGAQARSFLDPGRHGARFGANSMVLEISATPFIFTFKLWDWGAAAARRRSRGPSMSSTAAENIQWDRDTALGAGQPARPGRGRSPRRGPCARSARACTNSNSSRCGATGSPTRPATTPTAPSTC